MGGKRQTDSRAGGLSDAGAIMRLKVCLLGLTPMVWRRMEVSKAMTLQELHGVIKAAMGWERLHLFVFELRATDYGHHMGSRHKSDPIVRFA